MNVKMNYNISTPDGERIRGTIQTEMEEPVFINMELCIEKAQYVALKELCAEYKCEIGSAIFDLLNGDPEKIVEQYM